jgi:hypothetical protein
MGIMEYIQACPQHTEAVSQKETQGKDNIWLFWKM